MQHGRKMAKRAHWDLTCSCVFFWTFSLSSALFPWPSHTRTWLYLVMIVWDEALNQSNIFLLSALSLILVSLSLFLIFVYLFGCSRSQLQHSRSLIIVAVCEIFSCGMRGLVRWPGFKPGPPALRVGSLNHGAIREVLVLVSLISHRNLSKCSILVSLLLSNRTFIHRHREFRRLIRYRWDHVSGSWSFETHTQYPQTFTLSQCSDWSIQTLEPAF